MNLIMKGTLGIRGLSVLVGLLVCGAFSQDENRFAEMVSSLEMKLRLMTTRYRLLCDQYSNLATTYSAPVTNCTGCPDGWLLVDDQCFFLSTDRDDYFNSSEKCAKLGAHLATLTTKEQHDAVEKEGKTIGGMYTYYWIGLNDIEVEGDWRWEGYTKPKAFFWNEREPDNHLSGGPEGEDCVVVHSYTQLWSDVPCSFIYPRICQMDAITAH